MFEFKKKKHSYLCIELCRVLVATSRIFNNILLLLQWEKKEL